MFVFVAPLTWGQPILTRLPGTEASSRVALTFDDGPSAETTPLVLDALKAAGASATFFVLGEAAHRHPDLLRRIAAEGHGIGIHAYTHEPFVLKSRQAIWEEIKRTEAAIDAACPGIPILPWVRPPHGFKSLTLAGTLRRAGYGLAAWSVDSRDYRELDFKKIAARAIEHAASSAIVLLHDGPKNAASASALPFLLRGLKERGLAPSALKNRVQSH